VSWKRRALRSGMDRCWSSFGVKIKVIKRMAYGDRMQLRPVGIAEAATVQQNTICGGECIRKFWCEMFQA